MAVMTTYRLSKKCPISKRGVLPKYNRLSIQEKDKMVHLYKTGNYTYKSIGILLSRDTSTVQEFLSKLGFVAKSQSELQRKYTINECYFDNIDSSDKAYFLGFLYADGYNSTTNNTVSLTLSKSDEDILIKLNDKVCSNRPILSYKTKTRNGHERWYSKLSISSKKISETLSEIGCVRAKTNTIRFPYFINQLFWGDFVRGYFDGDGCFSMSKTIKSNMSLSITSNKNFLQDLSDIFFNLLGLNKTKISTASNSKENIGVLYYSGRGNAIKIRDFMYKNCTENLCLDRKRVKLMSI